MRLVAEYVSMGYYVADDLDGDPELGLRGLGKSREEAINNLVEQLIDQAEERAYAEGFKAGQKEALKPPPPVHYDLRLGPFTDDTPSTQLDPRG